MEFVDAELSNVDDTTFGAIYKDCTLPFVISLAIFLLLTYSTDINQQETQSSRSDGRSRRRIRFNAFLSQLIDLVRLFSIKVRIVVAYSEAKRSANREIESSSLV